MFPPFFSNMDGITALPFLLQSRFRQAFAVFAGCNMILAIAAAALCAYIAPAAAGSGIPEVKAYLNGVDAPSILATRTLFVKVTIHVSHPFYCYISINTYMHNFLVYDLGMH